MSRCGAEAHLIADGRVVGVLACDLEAGHDRPRWSDPWGGMLDEDGYAEHNRAGGPALRRVEPTSHEARIHWEDGEVIAEDDDEPGVEVPFDEPGA